MLTRTDFIPSMKWLSCALITVLALLAGARGAHAQVTLQTERGRVTIQRGGEDYFVRGAGGKTELKLLAECGANSIRTWAVGDATPALLDEAHKHGLSVTLGIWLERAGDGIDYGDEKALERQVRRVERAIKRHRKHPALLMWAIGNEMEAGGDDLRVYEQLERLAQLAHSLDPGHPTMTVIAEMGGGKKIRHLDELAPSLDVIGINSYGSAATVGKRYAKAGGTRPYMLTEFGPRGHWEPRSKAFDLPVEPSSTDKAEDYRRAYEGAVEDQPLCIGSYAFLWGHKQEATATWYGMLLPDGTRLASADVMTELWTGKAPRNLCPTVSKIDGIPSNGKLRPGDRVKVTLRAKDPDGDRLKTEWILRKASAGDGSYGKREDTMPEIAGAVLSPKRTSARIRVPEEPGKYRLFAYVRDGKGGGAVINVPVQVMNR